MSISPPLANRVCRLRGWLIPVALLTALAPKCVLCLLGYAGLAGALGLTAPEICGGPGGFGSWMIWLPALGIAAMATGFIVRGQCRRSELKWRR